MFNEAVIIQQDNQYYTPAGTIDQNMQYNVQVPVIGFDSSKFDFSLIFQNLQCADLEIKNYIGSSGMAKQIVIQHKHLDVKLKFIDVLTYQTPITLKEFAQTFNSEIDEPFPIESFDSTLKKTSIKQDEYDQYVQDAKNIDFNSLYPSLMSSEPHKFIIFTGGKIYMLGSIIASARIAPAPSAPPIPGCIISTWPGDISDQLKAKVNCNGETDTFAAHTKSITQAHRKYNCKTAEVSPLESIFAGRRHCGVFRDISL
ncbi:MAG: hypothetical protein EZS28_023108 [Streblomastix strix]|uniref:Uncharacterized protein n=1 Tax=Streblomastix strix TaxID=222440 RepID=A0A5J4VG01_9EUKA|nr:MAG: hypothetical protein EZS28_023108 [Streblomastix strix]